MSRARRVERVSERPRGQDCSAVQIAKPNADEPCLPPIADRPTASSGPLDGRCPEHPVSGCRSEFHSNANESLWEWNSFHPALNLLHSKGNSSLFEGN